MTLLKDPQNFYFNFDWPENVDESLKHETELIIKQFIFSWG